MVRHGLAITVSLLVGAIAIPRTSLGTEDDPACFKQGAEGQISSCNEIIESRRLGGKPAGDGDIAYALATRAYLRVRAGEIDRAIADYDEAIKLAPNYAVAYTYRALAHAAKGDRDRAMTDFDKAIGIGPRSAFAYAKRAEFHADSGDLARAIADFDKSVELDPDNADTLKHRAQAKFNLAVRHMQGRGVAEDPAKAASLFREAAEHRIVGAMNNLGTLYEAGRGVAQNFTEAAKCYRADAELGDGNAQVNLGRLLLEGKGLARNVDEGLHWIRKAAENGHTGGQILLGNAYYDGTAGARDYQVAASWYEKAARAGDPAGMKKLAVIYALGHGVPADQKAAGAWMGLAAMQGDAQAQYFYGMLLENGDLIVETYSNETPEQKERNSLIRALAFYLAAQAQGYTQARERSEGLKKRLASDEIQSATEQAKELSNPAGAIIFGPPAVRQ